MIWKWLQQLYSFDLHNHALCKYTYQTIKIIKQSKSLIIYSHSFQTSWESREIHFHHHRQMLLIYYFGQDQTPLLMHVFKRRIWIRPEYFINRIKPTLPGQKVIQITQPDMTPTLAVANCTNVSVQKLILYRISIKLQCYTSH